ncbi:MAG: DUF3306 domain-containing protein [Acidiferrobacteraceae bacterium]
MKDHGQKSRPTDERGPRTDTASNGPLARWSRRKAMSRARAAGPATQVQSPHPPSDEVASSAPLPSDADMPPVEQLDERSDYARFLSPRVSERLRRQALRKLFHLPQFNLPDGLDDYAEDYTKFAPLGDALTAELRLQKERVQKRMRERPAPANPEPESAAGQPNGGAKVGSPEDTADDTASGDGETAV